MPTNLKKVIKLLEVGVAKYLKESMMRSKFRCKPLNTSIIR